jgi:hypothetical protein
VLVSVYDTRGEKLEVTLLLLSEQNHERLAALLQAINKSSDCTAAAANMP